MNHDQSFMDKMMMVITTTGNDDDNALQWRSFEMMTMVIIQNGD